MYIRAVAIAKNPVPFFYTAAGNMAEIMECIRAVKATGNGIKISDGIRADLHHLGDGGRAAAFGSDRKRNIVCPGMQVVMRWTFNIGHAAVISEVPVP